MKKLISFVCALVIFCAINVSADDTINLELPFTDYEITVDGENDEEIWEYAANILLTKENTGTWAGMDSEEHILPIDTYLLWSDKGIYVFADVTDNDPVFNGANDCFEISFNPGGIIPKEDKLQGMFFMFWPSDEDGNVRCTRHNIDRESMSGIDAYDVVTKYKPTETGWTIEALIPWHYICDESREVYVNRRLTDNLLADFEHKEGEFLTATVCRLNGDEGTQYCGVYRTCTDNIGENFNTDSYNVVLNLSAPAEIPESETAAPDSDTVQIDGEDTDSPASALTISFAGILAVGIIAVIIGVVIEKDKK